MYFNAVHYYINLLCWPYEVGIEPTGWPSRIINFHMGKVISNSTQFKFNLTLLCIIKKYIQNKVSVPLLSPKELASSVGFDVKLLAHEALIGSTEAHFLGTDFQRKF